MTWITNPDIWMALVTLTALEIVLGIDNIIFIAILALSFLLLIGFSLVGEGLDLHIPKGYIYFAMAFSTVVELLNLKVRKRAPSPLKLRNPRSAKVAET